MQTTQDPVPYAGLDPDTVLTAVERLGHPLSGHLMALNSYENRVYQIGLDDGGFLIAKFYRPARWSDAAIREEHAFALELAESEIPVVAPLADADGETLHAHGGYRYAVFPRRGGRAPDLEQPDVRERLGRFLGRIHAVGRARPFVHRPRLDGVAGGAEAVRFLLEADLVPAHLQVAYRTLTEDLLTQIDAAWQRAGPVPLLRLHGDCHVGNILWTDAGPHFVDLDDCRTGPAIQDLWMLLSGERAERTTQLADLLAGYEDFMDLDPRELHLVEALRTLRMLRYAAWIAHRWTDPAFPRAFPWFGTERYWEEQVLALREQAAALSEPPLSA
jgi:Ser/Thr protein kinase RdoA (MazF antagonist)